MTEGTSAPVSVRIVPKARRMLRDREGEVEKGVPISLDVGRITFDDAATDLLNDYSINRKKTPLLRAPCATHGCTRSRRSDG